MNAKGPEAPRQRRKTTEFFRRFAHACSQRMGNPGAFVTAVVIVLAWSLTGPLFGFSDTWQLVINTGTTIVTFLMVFLIQATQNRDTRAIHLKLDELLRLGKARTRFEDLEDASEEEVEAIYREFKRLRENGADR